MSAEFEIRISYPAPLTDDDVRTTHAYEAQLFERMADVFTRAAARHPAPRTARDLNIYAEDQRAIAKSMREGAAQTRPGLEAAEKRLEKKYKTDPAVRAAFEEAATIEKKGMEEFSRRHPDIWARMTVANGGVNPLP
jgi:hypothetical protein